MTHGGKLGNSKRKHCETSVTVSHVVILKDSLKWPWP